MPPANILEEVTVDIKRIPPAGDPFTSFAAPHPHACTGGYVFLGYTALDEETQEEIERIEALPCRRCAEGLNEL